ncbi:nicotinamidase-related amidase [Luteimonas cucumeris]|uniref:Nicotinamidase-related amidase n=1 Tax=Luteimonas cucumeris TaxID=985012 RepID=A0A562KXZ1_9GAMM|nr:cysteine hydrolase family protein [Luteimonas cucumeris]TWI00253.1 nicotinamidase-related amidase [Luteimonas cucumeris]
MSKRALIVVDLQNEYLPTGKLPLTGIDAALDNAARVIAGARGNGDKVIHVRHESVGDLPFFVPGTEGVLIHPKVAPQDGEHVITKNYPNSFLKTDLKQTLDSEGVEEVTVIGAMSHMCIDATTRAAADFGYRTTVVHDACATRELEFEGKVVPAGQVHAALMSALAFGYATVTSADDYLAK